MKFIKPLTSLLLVTILIFSLAGCGNTNNPTSTSSNETLITTTPSPSSDFSGYVGIWSESDLSWDLGGLTLQLSSKNDNLLLDCRLTQGAPQSRVAKFTQSVKVAEIENNSIIVNYQDDGFGNSGTAEITFTRDYILVDFTKVGTENSMAQWGFYESTYKLQKNDNAYKLLVYDAEDYKEKYPDDDFEDDTMYYDPPQQQVTQQQPMFTFPVDNTQSSIYDTSKASGILASMGMTEEEFKQSCTPLRYWDYSYGYYDKHYKLGEVTAYDLQQGKQYLKNHPDDEELQEEIQRWNEGNILSFYTTGEYNYPVCKTLEEYLTYTVYQEKGEELISEYTDDLFEKMREYPNNYIGQCFVFLDFDRYNTSFVSITDVRDDTSNPNILFSKYDYYLYVIFTGSGGSTLNFDLIAIEKTLEN